MTTVILKPKKEESLRRFHPWVFSGAIARVLLDASHKGDAPVEGELVCVRSSANEILGIGHWQVGSIAVRILAFGVEQLPSDFWCERIRAAYKVREAIGLIRPDNNTFRLIHGEGDFLPGLIVDVYADTAVVQAHSIGMHESRNEIANALMSEIPQVQNVYYKSDDTLPFKASIEGDKTGWLITNHPERLPDGTGRAASAEKGYHQSPITNYDLIILDPPAFAKHRDAVKNALRGYQRINAKAIEKIRPGGILFTFSCSQAVDKEAFRLAVFSAAAQVGRKVRILHQLHQPQDHPINIYHPEGEYLKGLVLYVE